MAPTTTARVRRAAAALAVAGVIALGGCTSTFTAQPYTPGVGVNVDQGDMKTRALVLVVDGEKALLTGAIVSNTEKDTLVKITGQAQDATGKNLGELSFNDAKVEVKPNNLVNLTEKKISTAKGKLTPGFTAELKLEFEKSGTATVVVPVVSTEHADYKDIKA